MFMRRVFIAQLFVAASCFGVGISTEECFDDSANSNTGLLQVGLELQRKPTTFNGSTKVLSRKVVHIKLHKVGSTTVSNVLRRQCDNAGLRCPLMRPGLWYDTEQLADIKWKAAKYGHDSFDVHTVHSVFDAESYELMSPGAFKVAVFRTPVDRIISGIRHGLMAAPRERKQKMIEFMEATIQGHRVNENVECGGFAEMMTSQLPVSSFHLLDFAMLTEQIELSLVLFRRHVGLDLRDMLYVELRHTTNDTLDPFPKYESLCSQMESLLEENATRNPAQQEYYERCVLGDERRIYEMAQQRLQEQWESLTSDDQTVVQKELVAFQHALAVLDKCCMENTYDVYCGELSELDEGYYNRHGWQPVAQPLPFPATFLGVRLPFWSTTSVCQEKAYQTLESHGF